MFETIPTEVIYSVIGFLSGCGVGVAVTLFVKRKIPLDEKTMRLVLRLILNIKRNLTDALADGKITADEWRILVGGVISDIDEIVESMRGVLSPNTPTTPATEGIE